jgi:hypothetical protein
MPSLVYPIESVLIAIIGIAWLSVLSFIYSANTMTLDIVVFVSSIVLACLNLFCQMVYPALNTGVVLVSLSLALALVYLHGFLLSTGAIAVSFSTTCAYSNVALTYSKLLFGNAMLYQAGAAVSLSLLLVQVCVAIAGGAPSLWADSLWTRSWVALLVLFHSLVLFMQRECGSSVVCAATLLFLSLLASVSPIVRFIPGVGEADWVSVVVFLCIDFASLAALTLMGATFNTIQIPLVLLAFFPPITSHVITLLRTLLNQDTQKQPRVEKPEQPQQPSAHISEPVVASVVTSMVSQSGFHVPELALFRNITMVRGTESNEKKHT